LRIKDLRALAGNARDREVESYTTLVVQGEPGDTCFVLIEGTAEVRRNSRKVAELGPGDVIGEMALIDGGDRSATVTTLTRGEVLELSGAALDALLMEAPEVARVIIAQLAGRLRNADRKLYG
jgi:CRP/FNR family cyclic AMP-dependent transcriptional regulator